MKSLSRVRLVATPWTTAYQAPLSMGFSGQEYWSGVPLPSPFVFYRVGQKARSGFSVKILQKKRTNFWPNHCYAPLRTQGPGSVCWLPRGLSPTKAAHLCLPSPRNLPHVSARKAEDRQQLFHFMGKKKMPSISCCKMVKKQSTKTWFPELLVL